MWELNFFKSGIEASYLTKIFITAVIKCQYIFTTIATHRACATIHLNYEDPG